MVFIAIPSTFSSIEVSDAYRRQCAEISQGFCQLHSIKPKASGHEFILPAENRLMKQLGAQDK
jgi:hypothetical protein